MSHQLILTLSAALATPPLPVPPAPMSAPMAAVDIGGATVVFPHGARRIPRMTAAEIEQIRQRRTQASKLYPKLAEEALTLASQSDSWDGADPSHAEAYMVIVGPRPSQVLQPCRGATRSGYTCQAAHAGDAQGKLVRAAFADGGMREMLTLYTAVKSYTVSYNRFGPAAQARLHAAPGDEAAGERFIRSFRFGGEPVVFGPPSH